MAESKRSVKRPAIDLLPIVLLLVSIVATLPGDHHDDLLLIIVRHISVLGAYAVMFWRAGQKPELDRLIFYKATTIAFAATMVLVLAASALGDVGVELIAAENMVQIAMVIWLVATIRLRALAT